MVKRLKSEALGEIKPEEIMKTTLLALILTSYSFACFCQDSTMAHLIGDSLFTASGFKIGEGQMLKVGVGSTPDGDFKFIWVSATSFFAANSRNRGNSNGSNSLSRSFAGHELKVVRFDKRGSKKTGYVMYPIVTPGGGRYEVDIDNAINAGEIVVPAEFVRSKQANQISPPLSVADELIKLKKLLDDGVITQAEFDAQKKKILNQ